MFPLDVVLIGCGGEVRERLRQELAREATRVEAEFPDVRGILESASARGTWEARPGGAQRPRLFIIQPRSGSDMREIRILSEAMPGQPVLALLGPDGDQGAVVGALREGATQVALLPLQSDDFRAALDSIVRQLHASAAGGLVVAVSGVTGGAGATSLAINLAFELASVRKTRCVLADLSLNMGVVSSYLSVEPRGTILDLLREGDRLGSYQVQKALTPVGDGLEVLAGPHEAVAPGSASAEDVLRVVSVTRRVAPCLVLDVPCTYDDTHFGVLVHADHAVLVAQQSVPSARALKLILESLDRRGTRGARTIVLNRYDPDAGGMRAADLERALGIKGMRTVANDWAAMTRAQNSGRPLRQEAPRSRALQDIRGLVASLSGGEAPPPTGVAGLFRRVRAAFGGS